MLNTAGVACSRRAGVWGPLSSGADAACALRFIEEKSSFEYGQVNHALVAAMRTLVKEHLILVTQLEQLQRQGLLSLQKLWFYVQPAMRTMDILASLGTPARHLSMREQLLQRPLWDMAGTECGQAPVPGVGGGGA